MKKRNNYITPQFKVVCFNSSSLICDSLGLYDGEAEIVGAKGSRSFLDEEELENNDQTELIKW